MRPRPGTTGMTRRTRQRRRSPQLPRSPERRSGKLVTAQDVRDAAERLRGVAVRTPLRYVEPLDAYLKLENLQPVGAFKIRGAYNAIRRLPDAARRGGVITYSSGNHGQAVAYAAHLLGMRAVVVMPENASAVKVAGVKKWGGAVVPAGRTSEERQREAERLAAREGLAIVPPFDHPDIVAGQATAGLQIGEGRHRQRLAGVALVEDDSLREAMHFLWQHCRLAVEPSGAATVAAVRAGAVRPAAPAVLIVSGGNVDPALLED